MTGLARAGFPPVLAFPSSYLTRYLVEVPNVVPNGAENIYLELPILKQQFGMKSKLRNSFFAPLWIFLIQ